jgi:predicted component of type VI protein secretion system
MCNLMSERTTLPSEPLAGELIVRNGPDRGVSRSLLVPVTLIGSNENCDLRILDILVRAVHCVISVTPDGPHLRSVGGTTPVNGMAASSRLLHTGDVITVGPLELEVHWRLPPGPSPNSSAIVPRPKLAHFGGNESPGRGDPARRSASRQAG